MSPTLKLYLDHKLRFITIFVHMGDRTKCDMIIHEMPQTSPVTVELRCCIWPHIQSLSPGLPSVLSMGEGDKTLCHVTGQEMGHLC